MRFYLTGKQAQAIDKYTQETLGVPGLELMEAAAKKLAEAIDDVVKNKADTKILSVVESGNNGGDAVAAAWMLKEMGYDTYIYEIGGISRKTDSYLAKVEKAKKHGVTFVDAPDLSDYSVIIDGIFGVGLTRDVTGVQKDIVDKINKCSVESKKSGKSVLVVGVDIPSGISADTGHILGCAVRCDMTVTFEYTKYGCLLNEGREYSGDIRCESIGLYVPKNISEMSSLFSKENIWMLDDPKSVEDCRRDTEGLYINYEYDESEIRSLLPKRKADSNKGTYGKVLILAGSKEIYGAVYMAAEAAYRTGTGLVKVVTDVRNRDILSDKLPEAMLLTYDTEKLDESLNNNTGKGIRKKSKALIKMYEDDFFAEYEEAIKWADVILAGPGLGTKALSKALLRFLAGSLSEGQKLILDADALNIISKKNPSKWFKRFTSRVGAGNVIITPHMMEMSRIVKSDYEKTTYEFMLNGLGYDSDIAFIKDYGKHQAFSLSNSYGIITVLKDARTLISSSDQMAVYINTTGNSGMSKGGSGDVLAGMIAGLLAQAKGAESSVMDIASAAVHLHGKAGDIAKEKQGERSMMARDIIDAISEVLE